MGPRLSLEERLAIGKRLSEKTATSQVLMKETGLSDVTVYKFKMMYEKQNGKPRPAVSRVNVGAITLSPAGAVAVDLSSRLALAQTALEQIMPKVRQHLGTSARYDSVYLAVANVYQQLTDEGA